MHMGNRVGVGLAGNIGPVGIQANGFTRKTGQLADQRGLRKHNWRLRVLKNVIQSVLGVARIDRDIGEPALRIPRIPVTSAGVRSA